MGFIDFLGLLLSTKYIYFGSDFRLGKGSLVLSTVYVLYPTISELGEHIGQDFIQHLAINERDPSSTIQSL